MARHSSHAVEIPGVTSFNSSEAEGLDRNAEDDDAPSDSPQAEIAKLRAQLAATNAALEQAKQATGKVLASAVFEPETPHGLVAKALTSHGHLTSAQLTAMVKDNKVTVEQRHVLCSDGWWVNPKYS